MSTKTNGQNINELLPGEFLKLGKVIPSGALEARKLASGAVNLYWRFTINGKTQREPIGIYDPSAPPKSLQPTSKGYSIVAAMRAAEAMAAQHHQHLEEGGRLPLSQPKKRPKPRRRPPRKKQRSTRSKTC